MAKAFLPLVLLALSACAVPPQPPRAVDTTSACNAGETTYACQVERYNNVNAQ